MANAKANIVVDQGTTFETTLTVENANGSVFNFTGYTGAAQMRKSYASSNSTSFTVDFADDRTTGQVTLSLAANATVNLIPGRYLYDFEVYSSGNTTVTRVLEGLVTVTPGITRAYSESAV